MMRAKSRNARPRKINPRLGNANNVNLGETPGRLNAGEIGVSAATCNAIAPNCRPMNKHMADIIAARDMRS